MKSVPILHLIPARALAIRSVVSVLGLFILAIHAYASKGSDTSTPRPTPSPLPSQTIIAYPTREGTVRWVTSCGTSTWQVTERGIATRVRSLHDSTKVGVVWTDFRPTSPVTITGEEPVTYPVRIYNDEWPDGIEVTAYRRVAISGLTGNRGYLIVTPNGVNVDLHLRDAAATPMFIRRGLEVAAKAGLADRDVFPQLRIDMLQDKGRMSGWLQNLDEAASEDLNQPVLISDPMLAFAVYVEPRAQANFDREGNIMLMGYAPFVDAIPLTPELYDDSVGTSIGRTTKLTKDRQILWSVYIGPTGAAVYDNDNNAFHIATTPATLKGTTGTYQQTPKGGNDCFISKWSPEGRLLWRTYVGGSQHEKSLKGVVDDQGNIYVVCTTGSTDFPTTEGLIRAKQNWPEADDMAIFSLTPDGKTLRWGSYWCGRTEFRPDPNIPGRSAYLGFGDLIYDGHGGVVLAFSQGGNPALPVTNGAWQTANKGATEGLVTRFLADGTVAWSTLITTTANDDTRWLAMDSDTLIRVHFHTSPAVDADCERLPAIGVPGQPLTEAGKWGFVMQFGLSGQVHKLWAPFKGYLQPDQLPITTYSPAHIVLDTFYIRSSTSPTAIIHNPNTASPNTSSRSGTSPYFSIVRTTDWVTFDAVYTTPLLGVFKTTMSNYKGYLLFLENTYPSRGACLTDTLWGAGFGMNGDQRPYLVLVKPHSEIVGVSELTNNNSFHDRWSSQVFPNPASDHVTIKCTEVICDITMFDVSGRTQINNTSIGSQTTFLDVTTLPAGVYPTMITTSLGIQWHMIIK